MKNPLIAAALLAASCAAFGADVGVSITVGQPGFYGHIDIGNAPRPQLIYAQPVVIQPAPAGVVRTPLYLHVPPGHAKKWSKHCGKYNACGQPVFFVDDRWYNDVYVPHYRDSHDRSDKDHGKGGKGDKGDKGHGKNKGN
jgi:hypothetical protein